MSKLEVAIFDPERRLISCVIHMYKEEFAQLLAKQMPEFYKLMLSLKNRLAKV